MQELLSIETEHYDLVILTKDISASQKRLGKTLASRGKGIPTSKVLFSPAILIKNENINFKEYDIGEAVFFENKQYDIEFFFKKETKLSYKLKPPVIEHRLRSVEESFHYVDRSHSLRATINTGNDIGWFKFELVYDVNNKTLRQAFSIEILPTKIDMVTDLQVMNAVIDEQFPLWRFSLAEKTEQQMKAVKDPNKQFLLLWLAQFESLVSEFKQGLKHIVNAPHSRLMEYKQLVKMDKLVGKLSPKIELEVANNKANSNLRKRIKINKKRLFVDTPENRFIKAVISLSVTKLSKINSYIKDFQQNPDKQRLSDSFMNNLDRWKKDMTFYQRQPLFHEVGVYKGMSRESLVLQQKPGYAKVYKAWQQLKYYLDLLEGDSNLALRSISELYEIWCFLEIRRILLSLGFEESKVSMVPMINTDLDVSFKDGMKGAFKFERSDGIKIRLAHEPTFTNHGAKIKSWITAQKPDIFLEATLSKGEKFVWLFDAKYRIKKPKKNDQGNSSQYDEVPDDAINQMHRYRDALIHQEKTDYGKAIKTRPVFGAYALYPGFYDQEKQQNPYEDAINEIGIGAFSLLPSEKNQGSLWLTEFLTTKFNKISDSYVFKSSDKYFVEESPRIPYMGTEVTRFDDLVIVANQLGAMRDVDYINRFEVGDAEFYHTKSIAFERQSIEHHVVKEARYIAVAIDNKSKDGRLINFIYPILWAKKVLRGSINFYQSGSNVMVDPNEEYWLFKLGKSLKLHASVNLPLEVHFKLKLTGLEDLSGNDVWSELPLRYESLQN